MDDLSSRYPASLRTEFLPQRLLGSGGFGDVFLATPTAGGDAVAVKVLRTAPGDEEMARRFEREGRVTAALDHPHIVRVFGSGITADGARYIVYEFVEGPDLKRALAQRGELSPAQGIELGIPLAGALAAAHAQGVTHRDVKPENILLRGEIHPLLTDFGIARIVAGDTVRTAEGMILGTPAFLSPEVLLGKAPGPASDQFALAATLLVATTGESAYGTADLKGVLDALTRSRPSGVPPGVRGALGPLASILDRALNPDPTKRYPDMAGFRDALEGCDLQAVDQAAAVTQLQQPPATASLLPKPPSTQASGSKPRTRAWLVPVLFVGLGVGYAWTVPSPEAPTPPRPLQTVPPPTSAGPELLAASRALKACDTALRPSFPEPHSFYRGTQAQEAYAARHADKLRDSTLIRRIHDFARAARHWIRLQHEQQDAEGRSPLDGAELNRLHLTTGLLRLARDVPKALARTETLGTLGNHAQSFRSATRELVGEAESALSFLLSITLELEEPRPEWLVELSAALARELPGLSPVDLLPAIEHALARPRNSFKGRQRWATAYVKLHFHIPEWMRWSDEATEHSCDRFQASPPLAATIRAAAQAAPDAWACRVASQVVTYHARVWRVCPHALPTPEQQVADLTELRGLLAEHCGEVDEELRIRVRNEIDDYLGATKPRTAIEETLRAALQSDRETLFGAAGN